MAPTYDFDKMEYTDDGITYDLEVRDDQVVIMIHARRDKSILYSELAEPAQQEYRDYLVEKELLKDG